MKRNATIDDSGFMLTQNEQVRVQVFVKTKTISLSLLSKVQKPFRTTTKLGLVNCLYVSESTLNASQYNLISIIPIYLRSQRSEDQANMRMRKACSLCVHL